MGRIYDFKRDIYYQITDALKKYPTVFLYGQRRTGKTVCMKQLAETLPDACYYDIGSMEQFDALILKNNIQTSIKNNESRIYLIDNPMYWLQPDGVIAEIECAYYDCEDSNTQVVFGGNPPNALRAWGYRSFGRDAKHIFADFLSYPEWLRYHGLDEVSEQTYNRYLFGAKDFYSSFVSPDGFLRGCFEDTQLSNEKSVSIIYDNECGHLNEMLLKDILYATLTDAFGAAEAKSDRIVTEHLNAYSCFDFDTLIRGYIFLQKWGLVTLTYISPETHNFGNIADTPVNLGWGSRLGITNRTALSERVKIRVRPPFIMCEILKEVFGENIPPAVKYEIAKCHILGLLPLKDSYEYRSSADGRERGVDYVNFAERKAIGISLTDKNEPCFDDLPDDFERILITKDQDFTEPNGTKRVPYYRFIYEISKQSGLG